VNRSEADQDAVDVRPHQGEAGDLAHVDCPGADRLFVDESYQSASQTDEEAEDLIPIEGRGDLTHVMSAVKRGTSFQDLGKISGGKQCTDCHAEVNESIGPNQAFALIRGGALI
jgi:hypothetical protein